MGAPLEMLGIVILGKSGRHGRSHTGPDKDIERHAALAESLVDSDMRGSEAAAAGGDKSNRPAGQKANQTVDVEIVLQRDLVVHEGR